MDTENFGMWEAPDVSVVHAENYLMESIFLSANP